MDKVLLRTFALVFVGFIIFAGFAAILHGGESQAQSGVEVTVEPTEQPNPVRGQEIFEHGFESAPACTMCHLVEADASRFSFGPALAGIATRAGERIEGMTAEEYLHASIVDPGSFVTSGYRNSMFRDFGTTLTEEQIDDVVAYLMTLE